MTYNRWSKTAASNGTADSTCPFPENMAASALNDGARGMMAAAAKNRDDVAGNLQTAGTATAYTLATNQLFASTAAMDGQQLSFFVHATSGANPTLNVDGLGPCAIVTDYSGTAPPAGALAAFGSYQVIFSNGTSRFILKSFYAVSPVVVPIGGGMDYWGATVPNSSFMFADGTAISRLGYPALFAIFGITYGPGDGSTTFNLPDKTGRVSAMKESIATRLTAAFFGAASTALGAVGGSDSVTLGAAQIPTLTSANASQAISVTSTLKLFNSPSGSTLDFNPAGAAGYRTAINDASFAQAASSGNNSISVTSSGTGGAGGGVANAHSNVQPTIICNYIIRVI